MSMGGWELLIILLIILVIFGSKKLGSIGSDLGNAIKGFRGAMSEEGKISEETKADSDPATEKTATKPK